MHHLFSFAHRVAPSRVRATKLSAVRTRKPQITAALTLGWLVLQTMVGGPVLANNSERNPYTYSWLLKQIDESKVTRLEIDPTQRVARVKIEGQKPNDPPKEVRLFEQTPELNDRLRLNRVKEVQIQPSMDNSVAASLLVQLLFVLIVIIGLVMILRRSGAGPGQAMSFGKSKARFQLEAKTGILFDDVAGIEDAKGELQEVVTFLKKPERFTAIGARIPKGVLLIGRPGTGKTLLAKAIAGEAGVPFFSISGSEFVEMFVGVGASRVRDLFRKAKESAPCIVFIDEIDAVGRQRGVGIGGGNDEREQTLNQLLTEMDGFEGNTGVIIIAATNRPDVLDTALLRPGRFDRQITVDLPSLKGRLGILQVHAKNKKISPEVSLESLARRTPGFSGADLANVLNEAAILTARRRKEEITPLEIDDAIDRVAIGLSLKPWMDSKYKRLIAYHEVGHALLMTILQHADKLDKVTIIPRSGGIGGFAMPLPSEENLDDWVQSGDRMYGKNRGWMLDEITVYLGGRASEEVVFGHDEVTIGAAGDIRAIADFARAMVTRFGMSPLGLVALESPNGGMHLGRDMMPATEYSEEVATHIDRQIREIVMGCYDRALQIMRDYRPIIDKLVDLLIEQETLEGEEFARLVAEYEQAHGKSPAVAAKQR